VLHVAKGDGKQTMTLKELAVDHDYYCNTNNYFSNDAAMVWNSWQDFYEEFHNTDIDLNLCFRWDITEKTDDEEGTPLGTYSMYVFLMHQRKGIFAPHTILSVNESDVPTILEYLSRHYWKLQRLWSPLSDATAPASPQPA
jgi:hypothetical protein